MPPLSFTNVHLAVIPVEYKTLEKNAVSWMEQGFALRQETAIGTLLLKASLTILTCIVSRSPNAQVAYVCNMRRLANHH